MDANNYWYIKKDTNANGNKLSLEFKATTVKGSYVMTSAWSGVAVDTWYHLEFVRSTTSAKIFIDGTSQTLTETTAFSTNDVGDLAAILTIGQQNSTSYINGYVDEFRISKGIARHTANFTAPTRQYGGPSHAIVYDYFTNSFWPFDNMRFLSSCIADNGSGQRKIYGMAANFLYLLDNGNNDDDATINGYWTNSKQDAGSEVQLKDYRNMTLTTASVNCTPYFQYRTNWNSDYSTAETLAVSTNIHTIDLPTLGDLFQWKFGENSTNIPFELIRASLVVGLTGIAK